jgi:hypothetical protein
VTLITLFVVCELIHTPPAYPLYLLQPVLGPRAARAGDGIMTAPSFSEDISPMFSAEQILCMRNE